MKASVTVWFTRYTGRFSKRERVEEASFDDEQFTLIEAASDLMDALDEYVKNARLRRR
jgi:hypothetical protein